jgi:hypothetical protein
LNSRFIDGSAHLAAKRVDFFDQMPLANPTDGRVTRHLADVVEIESKHQSVASHARGGQTSLDPSMAGANDNYVVNFCLA